MSTAPDMNRIKQLRLSQGLSLEELADRMGGIVTKQALSKYELGTSTPSAPVLIQLARALGVKAMELWAFPSFEVSFLGYRKRTSLSQRWQESFEANLSCKLEERLRLQDYCYSNVQFDVPVRSYDVQTDEDAEKAAESLRNKWKLGVDPVSDLTAVLEDHFVHVLEMDGPDNFDGISALVQDSGGKTRAAAVVSRTGCPGERQRLSLAHELGHVVLKPAKKIDEEKAAFRFAAAFLAPRLCIQREIGSHRTRIRLEELLILKRRFGLSIQALLRRLLDLGTIGESQYRWWFMFLGKMKWRRDEPEPLAPEKATWLKQTVHRCIAEGFLTTDEGGKILGEKLDAEVGPGMLRRKAFLKLPLEERRRILEAQADKVQKHYEDDEGWKGTESDDFNEHHEPKPETR
jgi:Zn-dependent peptidase ImmA (M78 family)/transcriptional regulator with XRE-family HTH domain